MWSRSLVLVFALGACKVPTVDYSDPPPLVPGPPVVGAAEGELKLPIGSPLAGFTARCSCMSGQSRQDKRDSAYNYSFVESTGVQTTPTIKAIWIENGDDHLVWTKTDTIYSFDGIVESLTEQLEEATGLDLEGKVVHSTNHSHSSYGSWSKHKTMYLGSDKYNEESFQRFVTQVAHVAVEAYESREDAKIGIGWAQDWDPDDRVYRDRRGANNDLAVWDDVEPGMGKDPNLAIMRFDTLDDEPIAMTLTFGMHGIILGEDSSMLSADASHSVEVEVGEQFDKKVIVMFTQGSVGDASPAGSGDDYARIESIGAYGVDAIMGLWESVPTSSDSISLQTTSRHIPQHHSQIHVTRGGTVDLYYEPYDAEALADDIIYDDNGDIISPIDEFNTSYGSAFCGSGDFDFPIGKLNTAAWPYSNCMEIELLSKLILAFFDLTEEEIDLPLIETLKAGTTATRMGPLPILQADGTMVTDNLLIGFFPGEATAMFNEQWRRRAKAELGYENALMIGVSQDHEGYLLIPEDWLLGEYEADITFWGPLAAEHVMEGVFTMVEEVLETGEHTPSDPWKQYTPTKYFEAEFPTLQPDLTPDAGTLLTEVPTFGTEETAPPRYWTPLDIVPDLDIPAQVPRVQGLVQLGWIGGDPGVDFPNVMLEHKKDGLWEQVTTASGRPVTEALSDILVGYTPNPLFPIEEEQTHFWWAGWQAIGRIDDRTGLMLGTYRLRVEGKKYVGGNETWPWSTETYEVISDEFDVVPAELTVTADVDGLWVSIEGPANGYRLIDLGGRHRAHNPVYGTLTMTVEHIDGTTTSVNASSAAVTGDKTWLTYDHSDATQITITDENDNTGRITF
ncbi:MAG: hypothetical protein HN348_11825 [Proteobacteria bacterium]|nr:hypothetical protein [Pseudomonadota bacterium]